MRFITACFASLAATGVFARLGIVSESSCSIQRGVLHSGHGRSIRRSVLDSGTPSRVIARGAPLQFVALCLLPDSLVVWAATGAFAERSSDSRFVPLAVSGIHIGGG